MKRILLTTAILTATMTIFAGGPELLATTPVDPGCNFDGFYAGLGIGASQGQFKVASLTRFSNPNNPNSEFFVTNHQVNIHDDNVIGNGVLGYGFSFHHIYLGAEGYVTADSHKTTSASSTAIGPGIIPVTLLNTTNSRLNDWDGGVDLRPGVVLGSCTLLYARIGAAFNRIKFNSTSTIAGIGVTDNLVNTASKSVTGLRVGGGLEQMLTRHLAIRADYIYTDYGRVTGAASGSIADNMVLATNSASAKPRNSTTILSLIYHFG